MTSIKDFYENENNKIPEDFDADKYEKSVPKVRDFYEPYCKNNNISKRKKCYYHCKIHKGGNYDFSVTEYEESPNYYKPPEILKDNVSVVVGCMDREKILKISVQSWIQIDAIKEIIITDWSSKENIKYFENLSPKIKVIRIENKKYYNASTPVNIAIKEAKHEKLIKLDADYIINPYGNFNDLTNITENEFICGNSGDDYLDNHLGFIKGLNGFLCVHKKNIEKVGYYDESIENYGLEDCQMFERLTQIGLKRKNLKFNSDNIPIFHTPHGNYFRCENFEQKNILYNYKD